MPFQIISDKAVNIHQVIAQRHRGMGNDRADDTPKATGLGVMWHICIRGMNLILLWPKLLFLQGNHVKSTHRDNLSPTCQKYVQISWYHNEFIMLSSKIQSISINPNTPNDQIHKFLLRHQVKVWAQTLWPSSNTGWLGIPGRHVLGFARGPQIETRGNHSFALPQIWRDRDEKRKQIFQTF